MRKMVSSVSLPPDVLSVTEKRVDWCKAKKTNTLTRSPGYCLITSSAPFNNGRSLAFLSCEDGEPFFNVITHLNAKSYVSHRIGSRDHIIHGAMAFDELQGHLAFPAVYTSTDPQVMFNFYSSKVPSDFNSLFYNEGRVISDRLAINSKNHAICGIENSLFAFDLSSFSSSYEYTHKDLADALKKVLIFNPAIGKVVRVASNPDDSFTITLSKDINAFQAHYSEQRVTFDLKEKIEFRSSSFSIGHVGDHNMMLSAFNTKLSGEQQVEIDGVVHVNNHDVRKIGKGRKEKEIWGTTFSFYTLGTRQHVPLIGLSDGMAACMYRKQFKQFGSNKNYPAGLCIFDPSDPIHPGKASTEMYDFPTKYIMVVDIKELNSQFIACAARKHLGNDEVLIFDRESKKWVHKISSKSAISSLVPDGHGALTVVYNHKIRHFKPKQVS
jgi:hypothetical protein